MIARLLKKVEFKHLATFASPAFLSVVPSGVLLDQVSRLVSNLRNRQAFSQAVMQRRRTISTADLPFRLTQARPRGGRKSLPASPGSDSKRQYAHALVTLYFHQVLVDGPMFLDLRPCAFYEQSDGPDHKVLWTPAAWFTQWQPEFRTALKAVYRGYYLDDQTEFARGLRELGLEGAERMFRQHFGEDPSQATFQLNAFLDSFQRIFEFCKQQGVELKPDFVTLGIALCTLYENLDRLDVTLDARQCFSEALSYSRTRTTEGWANGALKQANPSRHASAPRSDEPLSLEKNAPHVN